MTGAQLAITLAQGLVGWALCGATMAFGLAKLTINHALLLHAAAALMIFGGVFFVYFTYFSYATPLAAALLFVGVVIAMDFFVVALLIQKKLDMFRSILGTWLPFVLISVATYIVGYIISA